jgi:hypothetical protein
MLGMHVQRNNVIQGHYKYDCPIPVGVGGVVECAVSLITRVRLVSPRGGDTGGSGNVSSKVCLTLRGSRHIQNLCGFSTPTAMGQ